MKYCSLDIETTGLDADVCDVLQFAAILDDFSQPKPLAKLPTLKICFIKDEQLVGDAYALSMHQKILLQIDRAKKLRLQEDEDGTRFMRLSELPEALNGFLFANGWTPDPKTDRFYVNVAGKNAAGFDLPFLKRKIKKWGRVYLNQRVMDPAVLYFNPMNDSSLPDMQECMKRAGIQGDVAHTATEDAMTVVRLLRGKFCKDAEF